MSKSPSLSDDEALWFPVHSSGGDSFSRPVTPDGAPQDTSDQDTSDQGADDGIGAPAIRGPRGPRPPRKGIKPSSWLWLTLWGAAALGIVTYAARKEIATVAIENWLKGQGVEGAHLKISSLGFGQASGQFYVGDAKEPEFSIGRFDVDYTLQPFAGGGMPLARVSRIQLSRPVVQFSFKDGKLNFGSLDKLIQSALTAPPSAAPPPESIVIDNATVRVVTDYGLVRGQGGLTLTQGRITFARVELPGAELSGPMGSGELTRGVVTAKSVGVAGPGDQMHIQARFEAKDWEMRGPDPVETADVSRRPTNLQNVTLDLDSLLPYRKTASVAEAFSGPTEHTFAIKAAGVQTADADLGGLEANLHLKGALKTSATGTNLTGTQFTGQGRLLARADSVMSGDIDSRDLRLEGQNLAVTANLSVTEPVVLDIRGPVTGTAGALRQNDLFARETRLNLSDFALAVNGDGVETDFGGTATVARVTVSDFALDGLRLAMTGTGGSDASTGRWNVDIQSDAASDKGSYTGLKAMAAARLKAEVELATKPPVPGAPNPPPPDAVVMLDRALTRFTLRAKGLTLAVAGTAEAGAPAQFTLRARNPIELGLSGGGKATIVPTPQRPLLGSSQVGAFGVSLSGPDLPSVALTAENVGLTDTGLFAGTYAAKADFDFYPVSGGHFEGEGRFTTTADAGFTVTLAEPATVTAASAVLGDNFTDVSLKLAQQGPAFLAMDAKGGFSVTGALSDLNLNAPNLQARMSGGEGPLEAFSIPGAEAVGLKMALTAGVLTDGLTGEQQRFNPLTLTGTLTNDAKVLKGRFIAAVQSTRHNLAAVHLDNDNITGRGALTFSTADYLTFSPEGLQPVYLSPLVAAIFSRDVTGKAAFNGAITWDKTTSGSGGVLTLDGLDYVGATGISRGLKGRIVFSSLAPMLSEPGQMISIASMDVGVPLTDLKLSLQFKGETIALESAVVQSPGGPLFLEPAVLPLDGKSAISGAVKFDGLDFGKIIAATDLATSMTMEGKLSGRLPFKIENGRVSISDGLMQSDSAGMISIKRTAVTGMTAGGTVTAEDPNAPKPVAPQADPNFNPFQDLAFQAMEWIHYDQIDARLNSIPGGKLNINFHIKGRFKPPQTQKAKISLFDYISGKWMTKPIKLPSDTPVELYLEVPINLDEILDDLTAFNVRTAAKPQSTP
ncbi:outer membrane autotransporter barrel [Asticcacaulis biprosthecium C19]|uniref:Outer membrane autotransporter barrel n=1 Tax=Asticcacaulis biprosthecium C19 TaxID=715226 RepID=F4QJW1_9CAUL|nr:YdbH domain-containing protein [Asticcacaulis biprosthecium]EGF93218.1 outer membrane autotransporter barrel [Asticcacaulis biprosthecium C19]